MLTNKVSDETIGIMIGGVVLIGASAIFLVAVFRCMTVVRNRRKSTKGKPDFLRKLFKIDNYTSQSVKIKMDKLLVSQKSFSV